MAVHGTIVQVEEPKEIDPKAKVKDVKASHSKDSWIDEGYWFAQT